jgi:predicted amidohydrolase YtcJ
MKRRTLTLAAAALLIAPAPAHADRLIDDIKGVTWTRAGEIKRFTGLLLTDDGKVKAYLGEKDKRPKKVTFYYDANGAVLIPGFTDGAIDMAAFTVASLGLDLHGAGGPSGVLSALGRYAAAEPDRRWLLGYGWRGPWDAMPLTSADLDLVAAERPAIIFSADGGFAIANTAAMSRFELTGIGRLSGGVLALAKQRLPAPTQAERDLAFTTAQDRLLSVGITGLSDIGTNITLWQSYRRAGDEGRLLLRIAGYADGTSEMALIGGPRPTPWLYGERLRLNGMSVHLDGPLTGRQAWMSAYADGGKGISKMTDAQLRNTLVRAAMDGFAIAVVAHGDAAAAEALFAFADLADSFPAQKDWRLIGADVVDDATLAQMKGRQVTMQSALAGDRYGEFSGDLRPDSQRNLSRMNGALGTGAILSLGSFAPDGATSPFLGLAALLDRADPAGGAERPARMAALVAMTFGAADASGMAGFTGGLAVGQWADFVLVDVDPTTAMPDELRRTRVSQIWLAGDRVWQAKDGLPEPEAR